jgi:hypothetical protein
MANKKPLVLGADGSIQQLQAGDIVDVGAAKQIFTATNSNAGAITIGQMVYVDGSGSVDLARANADVTSRAIGLVYDASIASAGTGTIVTDGVIVSTDWTAVVGAATLTAGAIYYLGDALAGGLVTVVPVAAGSSVVRIGTALSGTELEISIGDPIKL